MCGWIVRVDGGQVCLTGFGDNKGQRIWYLSLCDVPFPVSVMQVNLKMRSNLSDVLDRADRGMRIL